MGKLFFLIRPHTKQLLQLAKWKNTRIARRKFRCSKSRENKEIVTHDPSFRAAKLHNTWSVDCKDPLGFVTSARGEVNCSSGLGFTSACVEKRRSVKVWCGIKERGATEHAVLLV